MWPNAFHPNPLCLPNRASIYHWLVLYSCPQLYCDLHNDGAIGAGDQVGPYEIEHIDFDAVVDWFFFDTDFLLGATLLSAEAAVPGPPPRDAAGMEDRRPAQAGGEGSAADGGRVLGRERGRP